MGFILLVREVSDHCDRRIREANREIKPPKIKKTMHINQVSSKCFNVHIYAEFVEDVFKKKRSLSHKSVICIEKLLYYLKKHLKWKFDKNTDFKCYVDNMFSCL